jgi:dUTP pyrophosphatase
MRHSYKTITTDLGGELAKAKSFQSMLLETNINYTLKTTGAHSSAQNGLAEKPNQGLARMMRSMLYGAGLGSQYWSYALRHAVYIKNRLPHTALKYVTPYEKMNGKKPDLSRMQTFGAKAHYMHKERGKKLDRMDSEGTFMTFKGTDKIAYVIDSKTGQERTTTHIAYDEAYSATPKSEQPPMASALQQAGYQPQLEKPPPKLLIKLLDSNVSPPVRGSNDAAGIDIHSGEDVIIDVGQQSKIGTKIALEIPTGYYGQLMVRSSYASKYRARVEAGTIDADYRGEVFILLDGTRRIADSRGDSVNLVTLPMPMPPLPVRVATFTLPLC